jgi:hypothetical protein
LAGNLFTPADHPHSWCALKETDFIPFTGELSAEVLELLEKHRNVEYVSENTRMTAEDRCNMTTQKYG